MSEIGFGMFCTFWKRESSEIESFGIRASYQFCKVLDVLKGVRQMDMIGARSKSSFL